MGRQLFKKWSQLADAAAKALAKHKGGVYIGGAAAGKYNEAMGKLERAKLWMWILAGVRQITMTLAGRHR